MLSMLVAVLAMTLIFVFWYPGPLSEAQGVSRLVLIMIGVDVVIGPLITTIIFKPGKRGLRFDLMVIAALQTIALLYGLKAIHGGRPAYVVFNVDRFDVVAVDEVVRTSLAKVPPGLGISALRPRTVAAQLPADPDMRNDILMSAVAGGADLAQLPEYYVPLVAERAAMIARLHPLEELRRLNELDASAWADFVGEFGRAESELGYLPLRANAKDGAVIVDSKSGAILGIRMLTPRFEAPAPSSESPSQPSTLLRGLS